MKRLLIICSAIFIIAGCSDKESEVQKVEAVPEPTMTELAESNASYWGYIDYLWAKNGDSFSQEAVSYTHLRANETRGNIVCRDLD